MKTNLEGKVILVTGASGGIGAICAQQFAEEDVRLVLQGFQNMERLEELDESLDVETLSVQADLTDEEQVGEMFERAQETFGTVNVLVANAGVWPSEAVPVCDMSLERWQKTISIDQTSVFLSVRGHFRLLKETEPELASVVIVGSTAGTLGEENHADYATAKAGIMYGLTRSLKNEIVRILPHGRVNAVSPGWTRTSMAKPGLQDKEKVRDVLQTQSLDRVGRPEDVANLIVFLSSDRLAGHITGELITVAGGKEGRLLHSREQVNPRDV